jgi:predicted transcriptional regulator
MPTLKEMRLSLGLTQTELANLVGCNQTTINRVENYGTGRNTTISMIHHVLASLIEENRQNASNKTKKEENNKQPLSCAECAKKDSEIAELKRQISLLIETNAVLASKPSNATHVCGATSGGLKNKEKTA